ncbi:5-hydroxytryptamine receptor 3A-like [Pseudophryne corroboree]|uniref:5-hydroxytryptamine receptor 3A-like n=1 Tax=Pseudophryne corroboree TaxID=495146 RepID=UPI003081B59F
MSPYSVSILLTVILLGTCHCQSICSFNDVLQNLTNIPGPEERPVKNWRSPSIVYIDLSLYSIVSLDTSLQTLTTYIWFNMAWENDFISWNPDDFCGIQQLLIPNSNFWLPDLFIYEMTETGNSIPLLQYLTITSFGRIINAMPLQIVSSCDMNIFKFPFDIQTCTLSFGSYVFSVEDIIMLSNSNSSQVRKNTQEIFASKGDWSLLNITVKDDNFTSEGVEHSQVIYKITIQRSSIVYVINLIIPACLMVLLDLASMFIHIGNEERLGFKITVVLGFSVLLLILNGILPSSDNPPVLGIFCCVCLAAMVISIMGSIAISYMLMLSESHPDVPAWIKLWIMKHLARVLLFKVKYHQQDQLVSEEVRKRDRDYKKGEADKSTEKRKKNIQTGLKVPTEVKLLKKLLEEVLKIRQELLVPNAKSKSMSDWHFAATVVDRLILIIYFITVIIMFAVVIVVWIA